MYRDTQKEVTIILLHSVSTMHSNSLMALYPNYKEYNNRIVIMTLAKRLIQGMKA